MAAFFVFEKMPKKILIIFFSIIAIAGGVAALSAFEAHIINVTADIVNGLTVNIEEMPFGTVIPQEYLTKDFTISLSEGFLAEQRLVGIAYEIRQKPKPIWPQTTECISAIGQKTIDDLRTYCHSNSSDLVCCYRSLCPFLSKQDADPEDNNDTQALSYFQGNHCVTPGEASGKLEKPSDTSDKWTIDLKVPPVAGSVGQDWPSDCPKIAAEAKYGCDLWIEVTGVSTTTGPQCVPQTEICDGLDNDCDGQVDEGNVCAVCGDGLIQVQAGEECDDNNTSNGDGCSSTCLVEPGYVCDGQPSVCTLMDVDGDGYTVAQGDCNDSNPSVHPGAPELCNGLDDNCDGIIDNGDPGGGPACSTGLLGICNAGTRHCQSGVLQCVQNLQPSAETCNGLDDDCDGVVDEGDPGGGGACNTGMLGICSAGTVHCQSGALSCIQNVQSTTEVCGNGLDDDCDGQVDEGCLCSPGCFTKLDWRWLL